MKRRKLNVSAIRYNRNINQMIQPWSENNQYRESFNLSFGDRLRRHLNHFHAVVAFANTRLHFQL